MHVFIVIAVPIIVVVLIFARLSYVDLRTPSPIALGSALSKLCVVSADEIHDYCETGGNGISRPGHLLRQTGSKQAKVIRRYIEQMKWNTKLFQQVARFEELKIDPAKSSLDYETRETLALRLVDEAAAVRWLLVKGHVSLTIRAVTGTKLRRQAVEKLRKLTTEYKQLEQDAVALVSMATDDCYYTMVVERLGLSNWGLIEGGSVAPQEP
jgi:hypothetical protein